MNFVQTTEDNGRVNGKYHIGSKFYKWADSTKEDPLVIRLVGMTKDMKNYVFLYKDKIISTPIATFECLGYEYLLPTNLIMFIISTSIDNKEEYINAYCINAYTNNIYWRTTLTSNRYIVDKAVTDAGDMLVDVNVSKAIIIDAYIGDTVNSICNIIDSSEYDNWFSRFKESDINLPEGLHSLIYRINSLHEFIEYMIDGFYTSPYDIHYHPDGKIYPESNEVSEDIAEYIYELLHGEEITNIFCVKYEPSIDIDSIKREHIIIATNDGVYIVAYDIKE